MNGAVGSAPKAHTDLSRHPAGESPVSVKKKMGAGLIFLGTSYGVMGIAWSQVVLSIIALLINTRYTRILLGYSAAEQSRELAPAMTAAVIMAIFVRMVDQVMRVRPHTALGILIPVGSGLYIGMISLTHLKAFEHVKVLFLSDRKVSKEFTDGQAPQ